MKQCNNDNKKGTKKKQKRNKKKEKGKEGDYRAESLRSFEN